MWLNTMIPKRGEAACSDCMTLDGQVYCTMNCGPRAEVRTIALQRWPSVERKKTRVKTSAPPTGSQQTT